MGGQHSKCKFDFSVGEVPVVYGLLLIIGCRQTLLKFRLQGAPLLMVMCSPGARSTTGRPQRPREAMRCQPRLERVLTVLFS